MSRIVLKSIVVSAAVLGMCAVSSAADFKICNQSRNQDVLIFQVEKAHQQNKYSHNWLKGPLHPGRCTNANFNNVDYPCDIRFKATFANGKVDKAVTNVCRNRVVKVYYK
jgi:uncharacterized membrane protein